MPIEVNWKGVGWGGGVGGLVVCECIYQAVSRVTAHPNFSTNPNFTALGGWARDYGIKDSSFYYYSFSSSFFPVFVALLYSIIKIIILFACFFCTNLLTIFQWR